jgi:hypothetical protein
VAHDFEIGRADEIAGVELVVIVGMHRKPIAILAVIGEPQAIQVFAPSLFA